MSSLSCLAFFSCWFRVKDEVQIHAFFFRPESDARLSCVQTSSGRRTGQVVLAAHTTSESGAWDIHSQTRMNLLEAWKQRAWRCSWA